MVQATDTGKCNNITQLLRFNNSGFRRVFAQRQVSPARMIAINVFSKNPPQMPLVHDDDMVQTFPADRSDNTFAKWILPWRARHRDNLLNTQAVDPSLDPLTKNGIPIAQHVSWCGFERKSLHQLLGRPPSCGVRCNIEMHDVTTVMAEHDKHVENAKCSSRDREEINPDYTVGVVLEKRLPGL